VPGSVEVPLDKPLSPIPNTHMKPSQNAANERIALAGKSKMKEITMAKLAAISSVLARCNSKQCNTPSLR
jgi:hypothetical protein